jgi:hypothetical protein
MENGRAWVHDLLHIPRGSRKWGSTRPGNSRDRPWSAVLQGISKKGSPSLNSPRRDFLPGPRNPGKFCKGQLPGFQRIWRGSKKKKDLTLSSQALGNSWSGRLDLNQRLLAPEASALPGCATPRLCLHHKDKSIGYQGKCSPAHLQFLLLVGVRAEGIWVIRLGGIIVF